MCNTAHYPYKNLAVNGWDVGEEMRFRATLYGHPCSLLPNTWNVLLATRKEGGRGGEGVRGSRNLVRVSHHVPSTWRTAYWRVAGECAP